MTVRNGRVAIAKAIRYPALVQPHGCSMPPPLESPRGRMLSNAAERWPASIFSVQDHSESAMKLSKFVLFAACASSLMVQPAGAAGRTDDSVVEVVTFKLKPGVTAAEFAPVDKRVETLHVSRQPGFISRESAAGPNGEMLAIVHWRSIKDAEASMASFEKAPAAAEFMDKIDASTMSMKRYQK